MTDTPTSPAPGPSPWRYLILDRDPADPIWVIATVTLPADVRPAALDAGRYRDWSEVTEWVRAQIGRPVQLTPLHDPLVWLIDEAGR